MAAETELDVRIKVTDELSPTLSQLESRIIRWVGAVSASLATLKLAAAPVNAAANLERELANVAKTTNFLPSQIKEVSDALLELSLRTDVATIDLVKIAAAAGQQGLGKTGVAGVVAFTESVSRMASVLDVTAEDAGSNIGKILNIFKTPIGDIERVVSSFNQVSNNSTAKGEELLDVVKRIGDATGKLKVAEAIGLAATGLDLGISPEVVGSTFSTIFSKVDQKAEEFGKLLQIPTQKWIELIEKDGLTALNRVVGALRTLRPQDQQNAIVKLIGGGRQGSLVNKLVQDTQDAVLKKNLENARVGFQEGTSAIREQATVMNTVVAQARAAMNSLFKTGVDAVGESLDPLQRYLRQLNQALQSDGLKSFLQSIARSIMDMVDALVTAVKFISSLNVNWENFIAVGKVFLGLKLGQYLAGSLSGGAKAYGDSLQYILKGTVAATAATKNLTAAQAAQAQTDAAVKTSLASRLLGYEELSRKMAVYRAAKEAERKAELDAANAAKAAQAAKVAAAVPAGRNQAATSQVNTATAAVNKAKTGIAAAQKQLADAELAVQQQLAAKLAAASTADFAKRLAIQQDYETKKAQIIATGSRAGLAAITAARDAEMAAQDAAYARSVTATESYYARRLSVVRAGEAANIAASKAGLAASLSALDGAIAKQAITGAAGANSAAQVAAANAALVTTTARLTAAQKAASLASSAMANFGLVMRTLGTVVAAAGKLIASGFFWVTIIYSIGDAFGLFDGLGAKFTALTDKIGLTSEAARKAAVQRETDIKKEKEHAIAIQETVDKYEKLIDVRGRLTELGKTNVAGTVAEFTAAEDDTSRAAALNKLILLQDAVAKNQEQAAARIKAADVDLVDGLRAKIAEYETEIKRIQDATIQTGVLYMDEFGRPVGNSAEENAPKLVELADKIREAQTQLQTLATQSGASKERLDELGRTAAELNKAFASMFTNETLAAAQNQGLQFVELQLAADKAKKAMADANEVAATSGSVEDKTKAAVAATQYDEMRIKVDQAREALVQLIAKEQGLAGPNQAAFNAWEAFKSLILGSAAAAQTAINGATAAQKANAKAVNAAAIPTTKPKKSSGTETFTPSGKGESAESKARKEARARLELERAQIQAENNLKEAQTKTLLDLDQQLYDRGLKQLQQYYDDRKAAQLQANQFDIDDKKRELAAIEKEASSAKEKSEQDKFRTQAVRVQGQIDVLNEQRKGIQAQNDEELRRAQESFADRIITETNRLAEAGILPRGVMDDFKGNLDEMVNQYRTFIAQLRAEGQDGLADSLLKGFSAEAFRKSLEPLTTEYDRVTSELGRTNSRIQIAISTGAVTATQGIVLQNAAIQRQVSLLTELLSKQEAVLASMKAQGLEGTEAYKNISAQVDQARLSIESLAAEQNKVAADFNKQTNDAFADFLGNLEPTMKSLKEGFLKFLLSIAQNVQKTLGKSISDALMESLGQTGTGGLGGFIQQLTTGKDSLAASGIAARGATPATPVYVTDASKGVTGLLEEKTAGDPIKDLLSQKGLLGGEEEKNPLASAAEEGGFFTKLSGSIGSTFGELTTGLGSIFNTLISTLTSLFTSLIAAMSGGDSGGWVSAIVGAFGAAHGGGVAGNPSMYRRVSPAVFENAMRYHTGGVAGLRPNEVPTILERGETIRTQQQEMALQQQMNAAKQAGAGAVAGGLSIRNVLVADPNFISDGISSAQGETATMAVLQKNKATIRQWIK
jgi:TP901 family phage tail tape measure protein